MENAEQLGHQGSPQEREIYVRYGPGSLSERWQGQAAGLVSAVLSRAPLLRLMYPRREERATAVLLINGYEGRSTPRPQSHSCLQHSLPYVNFPFLR